MNNNESQEISEIGFLSKVFLQSEDKEPTKNEIYNTLKLLTRMKKISVDAVYPHFFAPQEK